MGRNFLLRESKEITVITIILISIVLRTGKIIIMLLGGGYTELLWIIMRITGISVGEIIIENHLCNQRKKGKKLS